MSKSTNQKTASTPTAEQVAEDLRKVMQEAQQLIRDTSQQKFVEKAEAVTDSLNACIGQLRDLYDEKRARAEEVIGDGRACVQDRPLASIGIALGAGALIGMCLSRRH